MSSTDDQPYSGRFEAGEHRYTVRTYYEDTDAGGLVYHANFLRFFERARSDMLMIAGIDLPRAWAEGVGGYVVAAADLRYLRPARLGEVLTIVSRIEEVRAAACVVQQQVMRDGEVVVRGQVKLAFVGADGRSCRQPAGWIAAVEAAQQRVDRAQ